MSGIIIEIDISGVQRVSLRTQSPGDPGSIAPAFELYETIMEPIFDIERRIQVLRESKLAGLAEAKSYSGT
jgi:hypothetical protein